MQLIDTNEIQPQQVRETLSRHMQIDGPKLVLDMERSSGVHLYDHATGEKKLDFFGFFASNAVGMNHPKLVNDQEFLKRLQQAALNKVTNSDVLTVHMARFVDTFSRLGIPDYLPHAFFISGGALAVENAVKTAFDWKVKKNFKKGYRREVGSQVLHFEQSFHGRSGYTIPLTNTWDPRKTDYFPKFKWPRIINPKIKYPLTDESLEDLERREEKAIAQAKRHYMDSRDEIACVIVEPIQGEGGDNHFRPEFLQRMKDLAHENESLFIFDEVQTGVGITGSFWAHQALGVEPDIIAFGKKTQVCGILAGRKIDEVEDNVFRVPSRINSTWGGNLVDMVRFDKILQVIDEDDLLENVERVGDHLKKRLHQLADKNEAITNVRGRGLMCAFNLPCQGFRDAVKASAFDHGLIILACGKRSLRFRSPLIITEEEIDEGLAMLEAALRESEKRTPAHGES